MNRIVLQEQIRLGQRIKKFAIEVQDNNGWREVAEGTTVGYKRVLRIDDVKISGLRVKILDARAAPTLSNVGLFYAEPILASPVIKRGRKGLITMSVPDARTTIHYTTDGSDPTIHSPVFESGIRFPRTGLLKALSAYEGQTSETTVFDMDISPARWYVLNAGIESRDAVDGNEETWWAGNELVVHMNETHSLRGFTYLPTQRRYPTGYVEKYRFYTSEDGVKYQLSASGEFSNINNNPITQRVTFEPVPAAYFKFVAERTADGAPASIAELGIITKK